MSKSSSVQDDLSSVSGTASDAVKPSISIEEQNAAAEKVPLVPNGDQQHMKTKSSSMRIIANSPSPTNSPTVYETTGKYGLQPTAIPGNLNAHNEGAVDWWEYSWVVIFYSYCFMKWGFFFF